METEDEILVDRSIFESRFACELNECKGACCVQGEAGAPLTKEEAFSLEDYYETIKPYLSVEGMLTIQSQGFYVRNKGGELTTPCVNENQECAYTFFDNGIAKCAFEKAFNKGEIDFQKPVSCHLFPIREAKMGSHKIILRYERAEICQCAVQKGEKTKTSVFAFSEKALVRRFGQEWYDSLTQFAQENEDQ